MYKIKRFFLFTWIDLVDKPGSNPRRFETKKEAEEWLENFLTSSNDSKVSKRDFKVVEIKNERRLIMEKRILIILFFISINLLLFFPQLSIYIKDNIFNFIKGVLVVLLWRNILHYKIYKEDKWGGEHWRKDKK